MKDHIAMSIETLNKENICDDQMRWEFLNFEVRKLSTHCSISKTGERKGKGIILENKIKVSEQDLEENQHNKSIKIRVRVNGVKKEKNSKFFLNLEKIQSQRHLLEIRVKKLRTKRKKWKICISSTKTYFLMKHLIPTKAYPII